MNDPRTDWNRLAAFSMGAAAFFALLQALSAILVLVFRHSGLKIRGTRFGVFMDGVAETSTEAWVALAVSGLLVMALSILATVRTLRGDVRLATALAVGWGAIELISAGLGWVPWPSALIGLVLPAAVLTLLHARPAPGQSRVPHPVVTAGLVGASLLILVAGHQHFRFLCDDAYIAFRYVSNSQLGHGYVWNTAPFVPVEGYTSFGWVVLMDGLWSLTGLDPTVTANPMSLLLMAGATLLVARLAWRIPLSGALEGQRNTVLAVVLLGTVLNRTWLAWSTSGLETALVVLLLLAWIEVGLRSDPPWWALWLVAALLTLTRPDGLLFLVGTGAAHVLSLRDRPPRATDLLSALPLALPLAHLLWRHETYGFWLPNTYYAKHLGPWPAAGTLYSISFMLEYALWIPLIAVPLAWARTGRPMPRLSHLALGGTLVLHGLYYTLNVGGDHFEYRVYSHLPPLAMLGAVWAADRLLSVPRAGQVAVFAALLLSLPLPWTHRYEATQKTTRKQTRMMVAAVTPYSPAALRGYGRTFDLVQHWLQPRHINTRHTEHRVFVEGHAKRYPTRAVGLKLDTSGNPVHDAYSVGIPAWVLPQVHILDKLGLNDRVVARSTVLARSRTMGHDRRPPKGYVECFEPNVPVSKRPKIKARTLSDAQIVDCETRFFDEVHHP